MNDEILEQFKEQATQAATLLATMSNPHRLMILCQLGGGELTVGELLAKVALSQSALSQHLAKLRAQGMVATRRESQQIYYRLDDHNVTIIIEALQSIYCPELIHKA